MNLAASRSIVKLYKPGKLFIRAFITAVFILALIPRSYAVITLEIENENTAYGPNDVHVMFYGGNPITATYSGGAILQKTDYTLAALSGGVTITEYVGGVIYVSLGSAMTAGRTSDPSPYNPTDADYNTRWDTFELTVIPSSSDKADLTGIDLFAIPIQLQTSLGGTVNPDALTYTISGNEMSKRLGAISNQSPEAVLKDVAAFLRVLGPTAFPNGEVGPYPTFDAYVASVNAGGQAIQIGDLYDGYGGQTTPATKAQNYSYSAAFQSGTGNLILTGGGDQVGQNHSIVLNASDLPYQCYAANPAYTVDGVPAQITDNDVYAAGVRDVLAGFAIGYVGSSVVDPLTGNTFADEMSKFWHAAGQTKAFSTAQPTDEFYSKYAETFYLYSNSYGFPFSDWLNITPQISIGPSFADTLTMTVLADGVTYSQSVTQAQANATSPGSWRAPASAIVTIPDTGGTHGLTYDANGKLIVRTLTKSAYVTAHYVAEPGYTIHGLATTDAAWVTAGNDLTAFYDNRGFNATNADLIKALEQGLGMNDTGTHDAVIEYAVTADNDTIQRPTKNPDITTYNPSQYGDSDVTYPFVQPAGMSTSVYNDFVAYYQQWRTLAYTTPFDATKSAPFTQLGYTYVWGYLSTIDSLHGIQGVSEFIILGGTPVDIYGIYSTASYIYTKNGGQYGNGYASFDITGDCDTVWAGHRFQQGTSASAPNTITIAKDATVSGGQGILVWSLNYNVTNNGTITGTTANKFGIAGTNDIAILFKGDTSATYGTPRTQGGNTLTNAGTISSPGVAIKSENGDTTIVNNTGATITGTTHGIWLASGSNSITNNGTIDSTGATALRIDTGTTKLASSGTIKGNLVLGADPTAALDIGSGTIKLEAGGTYTQGAGSTLKLVIDSASVYGRIQTTGASTLDATSKIYITTGNTNIPNNSTFTFVDTTGTGVGSLPGTISTDNLFFSFSGATTTNDLVITATRSSSYASFTSSPNTSAVAAVLNNLAVNNTATGDMLIVLGELDSMTTSESINSAMESMTPSTDNSVPQVTNASLNQFVNVSVSRLDNFQLSPSEQVYALEATTPEIWAQGFGSYLHQDPMASSNGYNATVWGTAMGLDIPINKPFKIGASGGFAQDFVRTKDNSGRTDTDSYQCALYFTYGWPKFFIDVLPAFAYNTYDSSRNVTVGTLNRIASSNYGGQQYTGYLGCGYKVDFLDYLITPIASFQYTHLRINGYEETGAGALSLKVDPQNTDFAQTGFGVKLARPFETQSYTLIPELRVKWLYDWIGDAQQLTSTFTGGGAGFTTNGFTPAQSSYDFGAKITLYTKRNITLSVNYDLELKEDYYGHNGYAELRCAF